MKKINLGLLLFAACVWAYSCQQVTADQAAVVSAEPLDEAAEIEAIMGVIAQETACFFKRDYNYWKGLYWFFGLTTNFYYELFSKEMNKINSLFAISLPKLLINDVIRDKLLNERRSKKRGSQIGVIIY